MKVMRTTGIFTLALAVLGLGATGTLLTVGAVGTARADDAAAKSAGQATAFWSVGKEDGKLSLVVPGQKDPVVTSIAATTVFSGICLDCNLPFEFKSTETGKNCSVCGCAVSNAACMVGKTVKGNAWQSMLKMLPAGTGLVPTYNEAGKPESGIKKLAITLRAVVLPVSGLDGQTPDQLLALVKPLGGTKAELLDGGKLLSVTLKSDWTEERAMKLQKAIEKLNGKVVVAQEPKA